MIKALISDFSRVLLFPKDKTYAGGLNKKYSDLLHTGDFNFFEYFELNQELTDFYQTFKNTLDLYILTSETIQDAPEIQPQLNRIFEEVFSAKKLGVSKKDSDTYKLIAEKIGLKPSEILYIDDNEENIVAASISGYKTILYANNHQVLEALRTEL
jgi:HAD superfamily hydrolase (TIGR01549 family)